MTETKHRAVMMTPKIQMLGRTFVLQLHMVLKTMRIHDPTNKALLIGTEKLKDTINTLWAALDGSVRVQFVDDIVYLNDSRLRLDVSVHEQVDNLRAEFAARGLGGLAFSRPVDTAALREFLIVFIRAEEGEDSMKAMRQSLAELKDLALELLGPRTFADQEAVEELKIDRKTFALQTYAKAIVAVRDFITMLRQGKEPTHGRLHLTRIVQDLVDIATERVNFLIKVAAIKNAHEYVFNHAANTCVLSIVIGKALNVDRLALVDLGTAAILADVPSALLPPELTESTGELTNEQRNLVHDSMVRHIRMIIGKGKLNEAMMRRVIVAYEHLQPYLDPATGHPANTHIFSRIVAVAGAFDALTTRRPWREGYPADEALKILLKESGTKFDPILVRILVNLMGIYPLGSCVFLDSGELAVVYHNSNDPKLFEKPYVKVIRDAEGQPVKRTLIKNLAEGGAIVRVARAHEIADVDAGMAVVF
jgi:HD-GYP domain-containing protein (c-di-GMP phosphodiesterase class II)